MSITKVTDAGLDRNRIVTPIIINGDMSIAQRGTSFTGQTSGAYYLDRFKTDMSGLGTWTITQSTDVPTGQGFTKSMKFDCTTADASPAVGDFLYLNQPIEGFNTQSFKFGSSSAESLTLSFWVKSNKTGTYIVRFYDIDNSRSNSQSYTISSASTWEKKTITIDGDTVSGPNYDNGYAFAINWGLGAGTNYTSGTLNTSWNSNVDANAFVGQVNLADSTSNEWYITGIQLEVGEFDSTTIPSFPFESYANNLEKCQRYCQKNPQTSSGGDYKVIASGFADGASLAFCSINPFSVEMRTVPSITSSGSFRVHKSGGASSVSGVAIDSDTSGPNSFTIRCTTSSLTSGQGVFFEQNNDSDAYVILDSEL